MKRKLFLLSCALLTSIGTWAGILDGWTKMEGTVVPNPQNYYFIILHTDNTLMLGSDGTYVRYLVANEPSQNLNKVWTIESSTAEGHTDAYVFRSLGNVDNVASSENDGTHGPYNLVINSYHENSVANAAYKLTASGNNWNIENPLYKKDDNSYFWGAWRNATYVNDERVAGNAGANGNEKGSYNIYYMERTTFNKKYQVFGGTDMNHMLVNRGFEYGNHTGWNIDNEEGATITIKGDATGSFISAPQSGSKYCYMNGNNSWGALYQTVNNLPDGTYSSSIYLCNDINFLFNNTSAESWKEKTPSGSWSKITITNQNVEGGSTQLRIRGWGDNRFADEASLTYIPSAIGDVATVYTSGNATEALKWYSITIPSEGSYYRIKTSNAATLRYTTNASALPSAATDAVVAAGGYTSYLFPAGSTVYFCSSVTTKIGLKRIDGEDYTSKISNANFEGSYAEYSKPSADRAIYTPEGWTLTYTDNESNNMTGLDGNCLSWLTFAKQPQPNDGGNKVYWARFRWAESSSLSLSQTTTSLPAGFYTLIADGFADNTSSSSSTLTASYEGGNASMTFAKNAWCQLQTSFYLSSPQNVTITYNYKKKNQGTSDTNAGIDNIKLIYHGTSNADVTGLIINPNIENIGADAENTGWSGSGRALESKEDWTGTTRNVFTESVTSAYARSQVVTFPLAGMYRLDVFGLNASSTGTFGTKVTDASGIISETIQNYSGSLAHNIIGADGNETSTRKTTVTGWTAESLYFYVSGNNVTRTIYLDTSRGNGDTQYGYIGGLKLTYIGEGSGNLDFAEGAVSDGIKICTYAHDATTSEWVYGTQHAAGWVSTQNKNSLAGGVINVGSGTVLGGDGGTVPTTGYDALSNGKVLGLEAVYSGTIQYKKYITLPAGSYTLAIPIYNTSGTQNFNANLFGFVKEDGTTVYASATSYEVGKWTLETVNLNFEEETSGYISLGYTSSGNGNASAPHLFVDRVMICDASANMAVNATAKWGTFCAPFDVAIPGGVSAYTCESASDAGSLVLEPVATIIPANTPVILNAESGLTSTTFYGKKVDNTTDDLITAGLLVGNVSTSTKAVPSDGSAYLLQLHDAKVGFYKANGTGYLIGNNRCYLLGESLSDDAREAFFFEDDATAISALEAAKAEDGALKDGKFLENGKIVIVKNGIKYSTNGQILK